MSVYIFLNLLKSKGQSQTVKAGPRRSEDRQACRSPGRRASGGTRASSLRVSFRVVGPLGCLSAQPTCRQRAECGRARGWEWGPLEGRSLLPDPGVSAFPNADAHHLSSVRNHPLSCMLCSAVCCVCACACGGWSDACLGLHAGAPGPGPGRKPAPGRETS